MSSDRTNPDDVDLDRAPDVPSGSGDPAGPADQIGSGGTGAVRTGTGGTGADGTDADGTQAHSQGRFAVRTYVAPEPDVQFADRRRLTDEEREQRRLVRARRSRRRRIVGWVMIAIGGTLLLATAWVGWRTYQAYAHLAAASTRVSELQEELSDLGAIDGSRTADTIAALRAEAADARDAVEDPVFRAATVVPLLGPNLDAIRQVSVTVDSLATDVMPSLVEVATTLQPSELAPVDGAFDLAPIQRISPLLQQADAAVNGAQEELATIDRSAVVGPISDAVGTLRERLDEAADITDPAARAARLLPPMLGANGPRTYAVVFQNPAEPRATGGIFGSYAVIHADQGKVSIVDQGAGSRDLGYFDPPVAELTETEHNIYSGRMAQFPQDVNFTPDFPRAAGLFAEMYQLRTGTAVDGVLAIDPVALSYTMRGMAPVDVGDGVTLTAENVVPILLSTAYDKFEGDNDARDAFLANATALAFAELMSGRADPSAVLKGLRQGIDERRVLLFSGNESEQADLAVTGLAGTLDENPMEPTVGVFLNDATMGKLGYYLRNDVHVTEGECRADGRREIRVNITLRNEAPEESLPDYVTGSSAAGRANRLLVNVLVFAPLDGGILGAARDGAAIGLGRGGDHGREVGTASVDLAAGATTELMFVLVGPTGGTPSSEVEPKLVLTPTVNPWDTSVDSYRVCREQ